MLRVNSSNVLVVPPWECAWLSDEQLQLKDGAGCVCFDVKGESRCSHCRASCSTSVATFCDTQGRTTRPSYSNLVPAQRGGSTTFGITKELLTWATCTPTATTPSSLAVTETVASSLRRTLCFVIRQVYSHPLTGLVVVVFPNCAVFTSLLSISTSAI